jgi:pilus assembly protein CpaE
VLLNLDPRRQTIVELLPYLGSPGSPGSQFDAETLNQVLVTHLSGVKVLLAPPSPEKSELVQAKHVRAALEVLREHFDYVVIDTWPTFEERMLHVLDAADKLVVPTTMEMPAIKNTKLLLDVVGALGHQPAKVQLVLNRVGSRVGVRVEDVEESLQQPAAAKVASDWRLTTLALNKGVPFVMSHPEAPIAANVMDLARELVGAGITAPEAARSRRTGNLLRVVFGT